MTTLAAVKEFHDAFGVTSLSTPDISNPAVNALRCSLIREELSELEDALSRGDKVAALDALTDLQYVLDGSYLAFGMAGVKFAAFEEVHRSNMSKLGMDGQPIRRADGKVLKGPNYTPPDLKSLVL